MLVQIQCDKFAKKFQTIYFHQGLNVVLGNAGGSNALGKSTFLWIIDYAYGGEGYCLPDSDIKQYVKDHTIRFVFLFDGVYHYFSRNTETSKIVSRNDKSGHLIETMTLDAYRAFLTECYRTTVPFDEITSHFFRVYGKGNTYERYVCFTDPREREDRVIDFLFRLFGRGDVLSAIRAAEEKSGIKEDQWLKTKQKPKDFKPIGENEAVIKALRERLSDLLKSADGAGLSLLGLETGSYEAVSKLQGELRALSRRRNELKSRRDAIKNGNAGFISTPVAADFAELQEFFPDVNVRALSQIESFHKQLHKILQKEIEDEIDRLDPLISECDKEIKQLSEKLGATGVTEEVTQRVLSQGVSISKQIDKLEEENDMLKREKDQQEQRIQAEKYFEELIADRTVAADDIVRRINAKLRELNDNVTLGREYAPIIAISADKNISFGTRGNTSEGTAFKSMVLYDMALLSLTHLPALVHDSNVLQSISRDYLVKIISLYRACDKQIFIAMDRDDNCKVDDDVVLELSEGHELFGYSWSKDSDKNA